MGKDWYWTGRRRSSKKTEAAETDIPSGCMCAVFQAFDFHPFQLPINQQQSSFNSSSPIHSLPKGTSFSLHSTLYTILYLFSYSRNNIYICFMFLYNSGAEAPRNSLECEDGTFSSISKQDSFKIPVSLLVNLDLL